MSDYKPDIWKLQAQFDIQGLVNALSRDDPGIRRRAAAALRHIDAKESVPALRAAFAAEDDPEVRAAIANALEFLGDQPDEVVAARQPSVEQAMVNRLIKQLKSASPPQVIEAAQQLGEIGDKMAVEPLVLLFNDASVSIEVRLAVAEALLKLESAPVEVALLANLRHADWHIRRNGAAILGHLKAEWAIKPLARALRDPNEVVRRTARAALRNIGTPESRKLLARIGSTGTRVRTPMKPTSGGNPDSELPRTPPGRPMPPTSGLLDRIQQQDDAAEQARQESRAAQDLSTQPLPELHDDAYADKPPTTHSRKTSPLDPKMLEEFEQRRRQNNGEDD